MIMEYERTSFALHKNANEFHKTTLHLAGGILGSDLRKRMEINDGWLPDGVPTLPMIWHHNNKIEIYPPSQKSGMPGAFLSPYMVNAALSIELHLKVLYSIVGASFNKTHDLLCLFQDLPIEVQIELNKKFQELLEIHPFFYQIMDSISNHLPKDFEFKLTYLLNKSRETCIKARYFDRYERECWMLGYWEIISTVERVIQEYRIIERK